MSEIKVNKISPRTACGTTTLGDSGDTISIPAGVTITNSGTANGFGATGAVNWQTGSIKTAATFTAVSGEGYFVDTSSNAITANLPAGSAGAIVAFSDYARNFATNNLTVAPNGSEKIGGVAEDLILTVNGQGLTLVYVDSTKGWINVQNAEDTETGTEPFIAATGGTVTTVNGGACKVHTFTGPGTFCVTAAGTPASNIISYLVVAGGGGGGNFGGGGGGGGFREDKSPFTPYTASPLDGAGSKTATVGAFPVVVGAGGARTTCCSSNAIGNPGSASSVLCFQSTGGGGGGGNTNGAPDHSGLPGGSGGGASNQNATGAAGTGNQPPVSPAQGTNGGLAGGSAGPNRAGGGGGATTVGGTGSGGAAGAGHGGTGATTSINGSPTAFSGGGAGGSGACGVGGAASPCGTGKPGATNSNADRTAAANTGGGGAGGNPSGGTPACRGGGAGGSGIVIIRYKIA